MIAISSFKPFSESAEVAKNQYSAKQSWEAVFSKIVYVTPFPEPELESDKTEFVVQPETFPSIKSLALLCAEQEEWTAIINADIIVDPKLLKVEKKLKELNAETCYSRRYQFGFDMSEAEIVDWGLDFFAATPSAWKEIAEAIPDEFRIAHQQWDTWMVSWMSKHTKCYEITECRCIFHPKHGDRIANPAVNGVSKYLGYVTLAKKAIKL